MERWNGRWFVREGPFVKIEGVEVGEGSKGRGRGVYPFISPVETSRHISFQFLPPRSITFIRSRPRSSVFTPRWWTSIESWCPRAISARNFLRGFVLPLSPKVGFSRLISLNNLFLEKCAKEEKRKRYGIWEW